MNLQRQQGLGMVSMLGVLIAFGFISYFIMQMGVETKKATIYAKSKNFYSQLDVIKEALLAYQIDKITQGNVDPIIFAPNWAALVPHYLPNCSTANSNDGKCRKAEHTLWGATMELTRVTLPLPTGFRGLNQIVIPLPPMTAAFKFEHDVHVATLLKLPFAHYDSAANTVTWQVRQVGEELQHNGLVRRSGDNSKLTGDWDVGGNFAITNAKDFTVRNSDGSQRSIGSGVIRAFSAHHGDRVKKHKCPGNFIPDIVVGRKSESALSSSKNFNSISQGKAYATSSGNDWIIGLDYYTQLQSGPDWVLLHDGEVNALLTCNQP